MRVILIAASLLLASLVAAPTVGATGGDCIGKPGAVQACATSSGGVTCAGVGIGLQGVRACAGNGAVEVCVGFNCRTIILS